MRSSTPETSSCARGLQSWCKPDGRSRRPALGLRGTARRSRWPSGCSAFPARRSTHPDPLLGRSRAALRPSRTTLRPSRPPVAHAGGPFCPSRGSVARVRPSGGATRTAASRFRTSGPVIPRSVRLVRRAAPARRATGASQALDFARPRHRQGHRLADGSGLVEQRGRHHEVVVALRSPTASTAPCRPCSQGPW